ncbi:SRPBCC domain-containing protein [Flavobacterium sp. WC2421]|uniref:SRPBCC domain-containing protein n=1 Tax=Flavobacterium sp. WC2409 TaxID=3234139 RepID=A0AB39W391_9FLAO
MTALYKTANYLEPMLLLEYEINANCNTVYNAWTDINLLQKWFYPTGFSVALAEMVSNVGGYFRIHMKSPEGEIYPTKGQYLLLDKPNRIVYKDSWDDDRKQNEPTVVELIFEPQGEKTVLKLYSSFATEQQKDTVLHSGIVDGWKMFFDNLNNLLKE